MIIAKLGEVVTDAAVLVLRVQELPADAVMAAAEGLSRHTGALVIALLPGDDLAALSEDDMRAAGWVRCDP